MTLKNKELSIWLIGPSAAGKTTVSKLLYDEIRDKMNFVIVDGDQVRSLYENNLGYDKFSRSKNTKRYINLVNWLNNFKISSIVAVISPFEKDRDICRKEIKNYAVLIKRMFWKVLDYGEKHFKKWKKTTRM